MKHLAQLFLAALLVPACAELDTAPETSESELIHVASVEHVVHVEHALTTRLDAQLVLPEGFGTCDDGIPRLRRVRATWADDTHTAIDVEIRGQACGADIYAYEATVFDPDGADVTGRSWPELHTLDIDEAGEFTAYGVLRSSCGPIAQGEVI